MRERRREEVKVIDDFMLLPDWCRPEREMLADGKFRLTFPACVEILTKPVVDEAHSHFTLIEKETLDGRRHVWVCNRVGTAKQ